MLRREDFSDKCHDWMDFLEQIERDLAVEPSGEYDKLQENQQHYNVSLCTEQVRFLHNRHFFGM